MPEPFARVVVNRESEGYPYQSIIGGSPQGEWGVTYSFSWRRERTYWTPGNSKVDIEDVGLGNHPCSDLSAAIFGGDTSEEGSVILVPFTSPSNLQVVQFPPSPRLLDEKVAWLRAFEQAAGQRMTEAFVLALQSGMVNEVVF